MSESTRNMTLTITVNLESGGQVPTDIPIKCRGVEAKTIIENGKTIAKLSLNNLDFSACTATQEILVNHPDYSIVPTRGSSCITLGAGEQRSCSITLKKDFYIKSFKIQELQPPYIHTPQENPQITLEAEISHQGGTVKWGYYLKEINEDTKETVIINDLSTEEITPANPQQTGAIQTAKVNLAEILRAYINLSNSNQREASQNQAENLNQTPNQTTSIPSQSNPNNSSQTSNQTQPIDFHIVFFAYLNKPAYKNSQDIQTHLILRVSEIPLLSFYKEGGKVKLRVDYKQERNNDIEINTLPSLELNHQVLNLDDANNLTGLNLERDSRLPTLNYGGNFKIRIYPEITLEMLEKVFEVNGLPNSDARKIKAHTYLNPIVRILNEIKDGEPAYVKYHLDTEERLAHFFAQCYHEVGGAKFRINEIIDYPVIGLIETYPLFRDKTLGHYSNLANAFRYGRLDEYTRGKAMDYVIQTFQTLLAREDERKERGEKQKLSNEFKKDIEDIKKQLETEKEQPQIIVDSLNFLETKLHTILHYLNRRNSGYTNELCKRTALGEIISRLSEREKSQDENALKSQEEPIANLVYADSNRDKKYKLGNDSQGEGWKYRGRGMKQLTGRGNYQKFSRWAFVNGITNDLLYFINEPDKIAEDPKFAFLSAVWFWNAKNIYLQAISSDGAVKAVTKKVNGGDNGLPGRRDVYSRIKRDQIFKDFRK